MTAIRTSLVAIGLATSWSGPSVGVFAQTSDPTADSVRLLVASEPAGASIFVQSQSIGLTTPCTLYGAPGEVLVEVIIDGYEPLGKKIRLTLGQPLTLLFVPRSLPSPPIIPESLGLARIPMKSLIDEQIAEQSKRKWLSLTETFAIVPFGQGLIAKVMLPSDLQNAANAMVVSGAVLTIGTYLIGKAAGKRKLGWIRQRNQEIPSENDEAGRHNAEVDLTVRRANYLATERWLEENKNRGVVQVLAE